MSDRYVWRIYCPLEMQYVAVVSATQPTVCPNDSTPVDPDLTTIMETQFIDIVSEGYVNIESLLSDNQALKLQASDTNGGIIMNAGVGGIELNTTNAIELNANAASNFTTTMGNLTLDATAGLIDMDAGSGINIGNGSSTTPILIGTTAFTKSITVGNNTGSTSVALNSGTGKISMNSTSTDPDAIIAYSSGGIDLEATGLARIASMDNTVSAITLDSSSNGGGIVLSSGAQGVILSSNSGPIGIGSWSGGDIYLGTAGVARSITIGNTTGATNIMANSGTAGTAIASTGIVNVSSTNTTVNAITLDSSGSTGGIVLTSGIQGIYLSSNGGPIALGSFTGGDVFIGTAGSARIITIGNTTSTTAVNINAGTGGITIGNNANGGEIQIGKVANAKVITIGNSTGASRIFNRFGTGGLIKHQETATALSDADATLTIADILKSIFSITPTVNRTLTLPTASDAVAGISGVEIGDAIDFVIINKSSPTDEAIITIVSGSGGSIDGNNEIYPKRDSSATYFTPGSGTFRLTFTNVTVSSEAYIAYRIS